MNGMPSFANPANLERRVDPEAIEVGPDATPLDFLQAISLCYATNAATIESRD